MCDYFLQRMEGDQQAGDLADIIRAGGAAMPAGAADLPSTATEWQLPTGPILFPPPQSSSDGAGPSGDAFGDPFSGLPDPFSSDYPSSSGSAADFFDTVQDAMDVGMAKVSFVDAAGGSGGGGGTAGAAGRVLDMRNNPIFPREIQMPGMPSLSSPRAMGPYTVKLGVPTGAGQAVGACTFDAVAELHMSSPRASGGIKRRKSQARKVVCIPAPAAAVAGRTTGEVVPSDLWAWRKYGQKPIKGSPYPRGYYRCSSSKGCPARKQVERSRTDPNMLVITYTSEHNHPWPTQRNVLAGSTRSHYAKNSGNTTSAASAAGNNSASRSKQKPLVKAEPKARQDAAAAAVASGTSTSNATPPMAVKEEGVVVVGSEMERPRSICDGSTPAVTAVDYHSDHLMQQMFSQSYRPMIPESAAGGHHDDFFADLTELESDPISLIFSTEYMETNRQCVADPPGKEKAIAKELDPFMLDWAPTAAAVTTTSAGSTFEQGERGL